MRLCKRALALLLTGAMALSLTGCSKEELREIATDWIIRAVTAMGLREESNDEEEVELTEAPVGGSIVFPEDFDPTDGRIPTTLREGVLYVGFNGIQNRSTPYFVAADTSVTVTTYASHTNPNRDQIEYKIALWKLSEDQTQTSYVQGTTVYYTATAAESQTCYTETVRGLEPGQRYKIVISYDTGDFYISGGMTVAPVSDQELTDLGGEEDEE